MPKPSAEFHFDFGSPNAFLSHLVLPSIAERTGVAVQYVPVLLGGVFKATGNAPPMVTLKGIKNKGEYQRLETARFLAKHAITEFVPNPYFPVNTLLIMRAAVAAQELKCFTEYIEQVFRHMWVVPKKMDDPEVVRAALVESGLPANELLAAAGSPEIKSKLISGTQASVERGVFGSPSFFVGDELFFGKDRLEDFENEIESQTQA